jgi:ATP synthase protein I
MTPNKQNDHLKKQVEIHSRRLNQAERERPTLLAQVASLGVLGLLFVLPVVAGAYVGRWLDEMAEGYSIRWTLSLIFLGLVVGIINVWLHLRE